MNPRILLVLCKQEYERRRVLKDALAAAPRPIEVSDATTSEEAQAKAKAERYDLIVAGYWLAGGPRKPVQPGGGLAFCEEVRARYKTPLLLVLPEAPIEGIVARCIAQLPEIAWTISGPDLAEQLIGIVLGAPSHAPLNIEIHTTPDEQWRYRLHGVAYPKGGDGPLELNPQFLDMARSLSRSIPAFGEDWYTEFERLGCNLKDALYSQRNQKFRRQLDVGLSRSNGIENTRVTFVVEDSNYDLALEAVQPPASPPVPWMVRAPLFRKVAGAPAASAEPFREEKPLKVLVVCADTSGYVNSRVDSKGRALKYKYPEFVRLECEIVQRLFSRRGQVHVVERLPAESPGAVDAGELKRRLEARWDIIHIAGHASYSARENRGYLVIGPPASRSSWISPTSRLSCAGPGCST